MKIYLGADHRGFALKTALAEHLYHAGHEVEDLGARSLEDEDDYPRYAYNVAVKIVGGDEDDRGILICGSGQGMVMAANRVRGVRAALAWDEESARISRSDDDSNTLVLPADRLDEALAFKIVDAWLAAELKADPKYRRRLDEIEDIYG